MVIFFACRRIIGHDLILRAWMDRGYVIACSKWNKLIRRLVTGRLNQYTASWSPTLINTISASVMIISMTMRYFKLIEILCKPSSFPDKP